MTLSTAIDTLTGTSVTGVSKSYSIDDLRGGVNNPDLPALLPLPGTGATERTSFGLSSTAFTETHLVRHRLLERSVEPALMGEAMANLVDLIDNYHEALQELQTHAGADDMEVIRYEAGNVEWGGIMYYGCDFFVEVTVNE